jgi:hypothetical protein
MPLKLKKKDYNCHDKSNDTHVAMVTSSCDSIQSCCWILFTFDLSALAITKKTPACSALVIHILDPLMTKKSPIFLASHSRAKASLPEETSDRQKLPTYKQTTSIML